MNESLDIDGARGIDLRVELDPRVNLALQQNAVPFVKRIVVENRTAADLRDVVVSIETRPDVVEPTTLRLDALAAGARHEFAPVDVPLRPDALVAQVEREAGVLLVRVSAGGAVVAEARLAFEVLAYDEWSGTATLPEILAAYVLPNHPEVARILGAARDLLGERTGNPALDGYQSRNAHRALAVAEAVYDAVRALELTYTSPPASFEKRGQKVRTPDRIVAERMATCLDLTLLFAACLEQAGLHPLIVVVDGHSFVGTWLVDESFPEAATAEPRRILKFVEVDTVRVFETTGAASRPQASFADALREGRRRLDDVDHFLFSVDVAAARRARIRPIPMRGAAGTAVVVTEIRALGDEASAALRPPEPAAPGPAEPATPAGRLDRWKRKLLDLSLRNRLLNHRETKTTIPLLFPDVARIEDALALGRTLEVCARPQLLGADDPRDADLHRTRTGEDALRAFVSEELTANRVHSDLDGGELAKRLLEISRGAKLSLEEGGANTLYLGLGFVAWYEAESSGDARLAPILLIPVELQRRTALDSFRLRRLDDDVRVNVTLLQKLKTEFGVTPVGVDPLPEHDTGVDVAAVLRSFREAILAHPRWHVREDAVIGLFSFSKYLMWLDLDQRGETLSRNAVVKHLLDGGGRSFDAGGSFPDESTLDDARDPAKTFCPLDADSSQLAAVHAAADGRSFVLQGPPGTGKSQTIANLIAQCLASGKRVLFVSEKMAALDVVHRRLERVGLGPFCLALHSNKAQKKEVVEKLGEALAMAGQAPPAGWESQARELGEVRAALNRYCRALHEPRHFGITAFQTFSGLVGLREEHESAIELGDLRASAADLPSKLRAVVEALGATAREAGGVAGHPLACVRLTKWEPQAEDDARRLGADFRAAVEKLDSAAAPVARVMGLAARPWSGADFDRMTEWCSLLSTAPAVSIAALATATDWDAARAQATNAIAVGRDRDARRTRLLARFRPTILDAPLDAWRATLAKGLASWSLVRWWNGRGARKAMDALRTDAMSLSDEARVADLAEAASLRDVTRRLADASHDGARLFGAAWNVGEADWDALDDTVEWAGRFRAVLARTAGASLDERARLRGVWLRLVAEGRDLFLRDGALTGELAAFIDARSRHEAAKRAFVERLQIDETAAFGPTDSEGASARAIDVATRIVAGAGRLRAWCGYQRARSEAAELRLLPLIDDLESGAVALERLSPAFERSFHAAWLRAVLAEEPLLAEFSSTRHALTVERFRDLDRAMLNATVDVVRARLAAALPRVEESPSPKSEMGVLRRQMQLQRRHVPLRKLFAQIPNALSRLKPCMLMSPLSVAQYLSPDFPAFDVVVFDEASQIPAWDAVGAIARGTQLVVVGDGKQLPPTNFFEKEETEEELDEDDVEEVESILEECEAAGLPELTLKWHYRSLHESLIAFSNRHYYQGRLLTFPSADAADPRRGVSLVAVPDGVYDKGRSRANRREAEVLVAELVRRLLDPMECDRSIGVVTFSAAQQSLVEDLLEVERRRLPQIERFFSSDEDEPIFVKNLENVQGDERDVILFSVCYGPDAQRRVYMNFGPLNRSGGERRLNVAITRAREQVVVFSTLRPDEVDLARTRAVGVQHLKAFLEYAERGAAAFRDEASPRAAAADSPFEEDVEQALAQRGWTIHRQVGCSGYRVDLAVVDPERPGRYLLGVECDGAAYHSGRTARDRDRLRASVLRSLGWRLHRVWSTDWWYEPAREVARIEEAIAAARKAVPERAEERAPVVPSAPLASMVREAEPPPVMPVYPSPFVGAPLGRPESFFERWSDDAVASALRDVVGREGPVMLDVAARRVAALWGLPRLTSRATDRVESLLALAGVHASRADGESVLWRTEADRSSFTGFRRAADPESPERSAEQIPVVELVHAVRFVLDAQLSLPREDLCREVARLFGISRLGANVRARMDQAVDEAARRGLCSVAAGVATLTRRPTA